MKNELEEKYRHPRDSHLTFDPEPHDYYVDGQGGYVSVTEIIKEHFPTDFDKEEVIRSMMSKRSWK